MKDDISCMYKFTGNLSHYKCMFHIGPLYYGIAIMPPTHADGIANNVGHDQTASLGAV